MSEEKSNGAEACDMPPAASTCVLCGVVEPQEHKLDCQTGQMERELRSAYGVAEKHPNCIYPLCGCAGVSNCKSDPMNTPLPCDVKIGATTFRQGVSLGTLVMAAQRWHREAFPDFYTLTDEQKAANLERLLRIGRTAIEPDYAGFFEDSLHMPPHGSGR